MQSRHIIRGSTSSTATAVSSELLIFPAYVTYIVFFLNFHLDGSIQTLQCDNAPHAEPDAVSGTTPHAEPDTVSGNAPYAEPDAVSGTTPHAEPHTVSGNAPHEEPDAVSGMHLTQNRTPFSVMHLTQNRTPFPVLHLTHTVSVTNLTRLKSKLAKSGKRVGPGSSPTSPVYLPGNVASSRSLNVSPSCWKMIRCTIVVIQQMW